MIIVVGKVQLRRGLDSELPGKPISLDPLRFSPGLDDAELGFSTDSGRVFVGHSPKIGDMHYQRTAFPYQNLEILTENSPRVAELFGGMMRDQNNRDFYVPVVLPPSANWLPVPFPDTFVDEANPARFYTGAPVNGVTPTRGISGAVEYHAFVHEGASLNANYPVKAGTLWFAAGPADAAFDATTAPTICREEFVQAITGLNFQVSGRIQDGVRFFRTLNYKNQTGQAVTLYIRRTVVKGISAGVDTTPAAPLPLPPPPPPPPYDTSPDALNWSDITASGFADQSTGTALVGGTNLQKILGIGGPITLSLTLDRNLVGEEGLAVIVDDTVAAIIEAGAKTAAFQVNPDQAVWFVFGNYTSSVLSATIKNETSGTVLDTFAINLAVNGTGVGSAGDVTPDAMNWSDINVTGYANQATGLFLYGTNNSQTVTGISDQISMRVVLSRTLDADEEFAVVVDGTRIGSIMGGQDYATFVMFAGQSLWFAFGSYTSGGISVQVFNDSDGSALVDTFNASVTVIGTGSLPPSPPSGNNATGYVTNYPYWGSINKFTTASFPDGYQKTFAPIVNTNGPPTVLKASVNGLMDANDRILVYVGGVAVAQITNNNSVSGVQFVVTNGKTVEFGYKGAGGFKFLSLWVEQAFYNPTAPTRFSSIVSISSF